MQLSRQAASKSERATAAFLARQEARPRQAPSCDDGLPVTGGARVVGVGEPPAPGEWPEVRTESPAPASDGVEAEAGTVVARPPEVVAHGLIAGIPWTIQAWTTGPAPGAEWWDVMLPVGPEME